MQTIKLNNNMEMPILGFGVYQIPVDQTEQAVLEAIKVGYRHIDTAQAYFNEAEVGKGIAHAGVARDSLFITTKVWISNAGYAKAKTSIENSLTRMKLDYLDLALIHQPYNDVYGTWRALEELQASGKVRAIGVSNFTPDRLVDLGIYNKVMPQVDQIEINPFHQRQTQIAELKAEGVVVQAWAPFAEGKNNIFNHPVLIAIGHKYNKSVAQIIVRWLVEQNVVVLSKSVKSERMRENLDVFDFTLTAQDKQAIAELDLGQSQFINHASIDSVRQLANYKTQA